MKPPSPSQNPEPAPPRLRRARPLLGTLVEIQASGLSVARLERAVENAFAAVERVQAEMSFHDASSDLSRINQHAARRAVRVNPSTWTVLRHSVAIARASAGRFDPTIAPVLQAWGLLPGRSANRVASACDWRAIRLLADNRVRLLAPVTLDLGGIAKGYAVDRAVAALHRAGVQQGLVNAGGDLRVFGDSPAPVHVRHPAEPGRFFSLGELHDGALATSALTWSGQTTQGLTTGALVDPHTRAVCGQGVSITVLARAAWLADALTKVVAATPDPATAAPLLARYRARAVILDTQGRAVWLNASVPLSDVA